MATGDHWEWRGFGPLDEPLKRRLRALWPLLGSEWQVTDRYLWTPGCQVNVKLRGVDLKLKRFLQAAHGLERWREDGQEVFPFPIAPDVVRTVADALGVVPPWLPVAALDQPGLWRLLRQAVPPVQLITVEKSRRLGWLTGVGAQRFGAPVLLEVTEVAAPEALATVAVEHPQPEPVQAAVTGLGLRDSSLVPLNYLQVLAAWAGGRSALDRPLPRAEPLSDRPSSALFAEPGAVGRQEVAMSARFDPTVLVHDGPRRRQILPVLQAALDAVHPGRAVGQALRRRGDRLLVGDVSYDLASVERVLVLGFGKAAAPMALAVDAVLGDRIAAGVLVTKYGYAGIDQAWPQRLAVVEAGHPLPDAAGVAAAQQVAALAQQATAGDLVVCLISGGGSALLTRPAAGLTLADLQATSDVLLRCGATIEEINTLRKHLEQLKGGQLAQLVAPARLVSLVLSDVVGSPLDVIASGPTVPDRSTWADAWAVVTKYGLQADLPTAVVDRLAAGLAGHLPDTPKAGHSAFATSRTLIIADNARAAAAAADAAAAQGFNAAVLSTFVEGEAREVAKVLVGLGREVAVHGRPVQAPACLILGGETTVVVRRAGKGGRNQELALAAALQLAAVAEGGRIVVASLATDGTDGPTDGAGGLVDATTVARGRSRGLDAARHLAENDAYPFLRAVGDLLITGPTQTNVNDLLAVFVF